MRDVKRHEALERAHVEDVRELERGQDVGEVHEEASETGDGDASVGRDVAGAQRSAVMDPDAFEGAFSRGNDINARGAEA